MVRTLRSTLSRKRIICAPRREKDTDIQFFVVFDESGGWIFKAQIIIALPDDQYPCVSIATITGAKGFPRQRFPSDLPGKKARFWHPALLFRLHYTRSGGIAYWPYLPIRCFTESEVAVHDMYVRRQETENTVFEL